LQGKTGKIGRGRKTTRGVVGKLARAVARVAERVCRTVKKFSKRELQAKKVQMLGVFIISLELEDKKLWNRGYK
jgi:hypothetical protein